MSTRVEQCWVLGFYSEDAVNVWPDARLAEVMETLWRNVGSPAAVQAWWRACDDDDKYAVRWYISDPLAWMLDEANQMWRRFVIGRDVVPPTARPYLQQRPAGVSIRARTHDDEVWFS